MNNKIKKTKKSKIHILDILVIIAIIGVVITGISRLTNIDIIDVGSGDHVKIKYEVTTYEYNPVYFENIKIGDTISEDKKYMSAKITDIKIIDSIKRDYDNNGNVIQAPDPIVKKAVVTIEADAQYKNPIYQLGNKEIRQGLPYFLETEKAKLSCVISKIERIDLEDK